MPSIFETIKNLSARKKAMAAAVLVLSITGTILLFAWSQRLEYNLLYSNLADSDAGGIIQKLKEMKVPYRAENGNVLVPADRVYDVRLQLAAQGLPHNGGVGFELFDKTDFGASDFVQKLNYRRALQGELARTIMSLSEIEQCRVHLAAPEKSVFLEDAAKPSASVLVKLRGGRSLSPGQVQGIVHLVSSSVEGLNAKDVTIVDSLGDMLTRVADDSGLSAGQMEYQRSYEKDIESRVVGILEPIVGKNRVKAKVTAALDFTKSEKTEEKFDPDGQVVRSEQKNGEKSNAGGSGGVPGVASNLPGRTGAKSASQTQSQTQSETVNYEISKITSHTVNSSGELKRLSVAVIVDGAYAAGQGSAEKKYAPRSEEDIRRYEDLVKKAVGFTAERGDEVRVMNMQFETVQEEIPETPRQYLPAIASVARYLIPLAAFALLFFVVLRPMMRFLAAPGSHRVSQLELPRTVSEIERSLGGGDGDVKTLSYHENVIEWAKKNPDKAAGVIKGWIEEQ